VVGPKAMSIKSLIVLCLCLLPVSCALAGALANGDFESGLTGWQVAAQGGAQAAVSNDKPAAGRGCLALTSPGSGQAWVLGPALPGRPGDLLQVTFSVRRGPGKAVLLLTLAADTAGLTGAPLWEGILPADSEWHKVGLLLRTPPVPGGGVPRLAFGIAGLAGSWAVDMVDAQPGAALELLPVKPTGEVAQTETLPDGWEPEGNLDARTKEIAGKTEFLLDVNGIEVGLRPEFACRRGFREGMVLYAVNRSEENKSLQVRIAAPAGVDAPAWTVPVRGKSPANTDADKAWAGTMRFHTALQSMRRGTFWVKLIVKSGNDEKAAPLKVTCTEQYPATAVLWRDRVNPETLTAVRRAGVDLHLMTAAADPAAFEPMVSALEGQGEYGVGPLLQSLSPVQYLPAATALYPKFEPSFWLAAPDDAAGRTLSVLPRLAAELRQARPQAFLVSPPVALERDWQKGGLAPNRPGNVSAEALAGVATVMAQLPRQASPCVLQQTVDGTADVVNGALAALGSETDLSGLRALLTARNLQVPMLVGPLQSLPGGDDRLTALLLARAMTNAVSEGATGLVLDPVASPTNGWGLTPAQAAADETPVQQVVRLLSGELIGATPLVPLADSEGITIAPDAKVCYKPFLRGGEGIVVLWNNTGVPKDVSLEFRFEPAVWQRVVFSYQGEFATRRWDPIMQFPAEAFKRGKPVVFARLDPLQVQVHAFRLVTPHAAWLRKVEFATPFKPTPETPVAPRNDGRTWWHDMLGGRGAL
jgi:hypothetical protein